jgi:virulence factor Mce-like protein
METKVPTSGRIALALGFALSCFGLLLFLWVAFGGPVPLAPESYRIVVPFTEATQLASESDVRISGVSVGKVKGVELGEDGRADATLELEPRFAPLPEDTQAILRQKTLLGETYVELTPGERDSDPLPEGGTLPVAQVSEAVQLDEILRTFDEPTRTAFASWMQEAAVALRGRGLDLSVAFAALAPFGEQADRVLGVLDTQDEAVSELVRGTGEVFAALSERRGQLRGLIENTEAVFATTARRNAQLADSFQILPTFLEESRLTLEALDEFSAEADPLVQQLRPAAAELTPTLVASGELAPELRGFFGGLGRAIPAGLEGLPALRSTLDDELPPLLGELQPFFSELTPILEVASRYRHELTAFVANAASATNAAGPAPGGTTLNYLRTTSPLGPGSLAAYPQRIGGSRSNPYTAPLGYSKLASGLEVFNGSQCSSGPNLTLTNDPALIDSDLFSRLQTFAFGGVANSAEIPVPPCRQQAPFRAIGGATPSSSQYLHVGSLPPP